MTFILYWKFNITESNMIHADLKCQNVSFYPVSYYIKYILLFHNMRYF